MKDREQITVTLSQKDVPKSLIDYTVKNDRSLANVVKLCIWSHFGNDAQKLQAINILESEK